MAYKITDKRKIEIVNVIAEITAKLKKFDEVECITWNAEKDETILTNIIDMISGNSYGDPITITGNILAIYVITAEPNASLELTTTINKIMNDYVNRKAYKQTGVDIFIQTLPSYKCCMHSDWQRLLYRDKIIYDKTPDNYYTQVFNQFEGYKEETNPPKQLYSLDLNLDINEELKLRLEKEQ